MDNMKSNPLERVIFKTHVGEYRIHAVLTATKPWNMRAILLNHRYEKRDSEYSETERTDMEFEPDTLVVNTHGYLPSCGFGKHLNYSSDRISVKLCNIPSSLFKASDSDIVKNKPVPDFAEGMAQVNGWSTVFRAVPAIDDRLSPSNPRFHEPCFYSAGRPIFKRDLEAFLATVLAQNGLLKTLTSEFIDDHRDCDIDSLVEMSKYSLLHEIEVRHA